VSSYEFLDEVITELEKDHSNFKYLTLSIIERYEKLEKSKRNDDELAKFGIYNPEDSARIENAYSKTLGKWFSARSDLSSESADAAFRLWRESPEQGRADAVLKISRRAKLIKRTTIFLEIILPLAFAMAVLGVSWFAHIGQR